MLKPPLLKAVSNQPLLSVALLKVTILVCLSLFSKNPEADINTYFYMSSDSFVVFQGNILHNSQINCLKSWA